MIWIILIIIAIPIISGGNQVIKEYAAMYDEDERKRKEKANKERMAREKLRAKQHEDISNEVAPLYRQVRADVPVKNAQNDGDYVKKGHLFLVCRKACSCTR